MSIDPASQIRGKDWGRLAVKVVMPEAVARINQGGLEFWAGFRNVWVKRKSAEMNYAEARVLNRIDQNIEEQFLAEIDRGRAYATIVAFPLARRNDWVGNWYVNQRYPSARPDFAIACHAAHPEFRPKTILWIATVYRGNSGRIATAGFELARLEREPSRINEQLRERGVI